MGRNAVHLAIPPFNDRLPAPVYFRTASVPAQASYPRHRHCWGEFVYAFSGVMEIEVAGRHYLAPPQYGIWLPPNLEHVGFNRHEACHCSLYVAAERCQALPGEACALTVSPLVRALLDDLRESPLATGQEDAHERQLQVLLDKLARAPKAGSYLPGSSDALLEPVLRALTANPADPRSLAQLARQANTTERTLMRRCQRDLGMSFAQWRQRLKVVAALALLEQGLTVEVIALDLGYSSASAFIGMFRRLMGVSPDEFRKGNLPRRP
ncbi:AraC family transcriptional regulator [Phytopseudomonas dryadis]|uniref:AraC family transcriptional regulator n=1 Tax=Phytopseudomonas dryadis TaxID=2487520 RepID=A0A4Q9QVV1_9GAMM|nr:MULTISPECIES: helix-turn-helix transcriptional regulator [Pseudomonas]TBU88156.1 AraC family transcriptional regulator [Pseudomonas dryadis]TBV05394.1 AraC family transcriptional regulator [Pseudomonas dryadis]TBV18403.1 AraC family transcriptional regulator [Pseudomonas sp. FRB 230]